MSDLLVYVVVARPSRNLFSITNFEEGDLRMPSHAQFVTVSARSQLREKTWLSRWFSHRIISVFYELSWTWVAHKISLYYYYAAVPRPDRSHHPDARSRARHAEKVISVWEEGRMSRKSDSSQFLLDMRPAVISWMCVLTEFFCILFCFDHPCSFLSAPIVLLSDMLAFTGSLTLLVARHSFNPTW